MQFFREGWCLFMKKPYKFKKVLTILIALVLCAGVLLPKSISGEGTNEGTIYQLLTGTYGFNGAQASGIMASIYAESRFDPNATTPSGGSYGLIQWTGGRKSVFYSYCTSNNMDSSSVSAQLSYMYYELTHGESKAMSKLSGIEDSSDGAYTAGYNFCYYFERPKAKASASVSRATRARDVYYATYGASSNASTINTAIADSNVATDPVTQDETTTDATVDDKADLSNTTTTEVSTKKKTKLTAGTYKIKKTMAVRKKASKKGKVLGYIKKGKKVRVKIVKNVKWGKIKYKGRNAYVSLRYSAKVKFK